MKNLFGTLVVVIVNEDIGEYLDYKNCKCRNKLVDKLVEECIKNIDGNEIIYNETLNENVCNSCKIYIVLY